MGAREAGRQETGALGGRGHTIDPLLGRPSIKAVISSRLLLMHAQCKGVDRSPHSLPPGAVTWAWKLISTHEGD